MCLEMEYTLQQCEKLRANELRDTFLRVTGRLVLDTQERAFFEREAEIARMLIQSGYDVISRRHIEVYPCLT